MCDCNDRSPSFYTRKIVKGRKEHRCQECLRTIVKGEPHEVSKGKWEDDFETFRTCQLCLDMVNEIGLDCYCHSELFESVDESYFPDIESVAVFQRRRKQNWDRVVGNLQKATVGAGKIHA